MLIKAYAKINWTLGVKGTRLDGYHDLDMIMQSVDLCDDVEICEADGFSLVIDGPRGAGLSAGDDNLMLRAARLIQSAAGVSSGAALRLTKRVPMQAGMGGGSSDAAAVLKGLNAMWHVGMNESELCALGLKLGADVPYCIAGGLCRAEGLGEQLTHVKAAQSVSLIAAMPAVGLSTGEVFRRCKSGMAQDTPRAIEALNAGDWQWLRANTRNDLEQPARDMRPEIDACISAMYDAGAKFARMTGSGSAVYGVFDDADIDAAFEAIHRAYPDSFIAYTLV